MPHELARGRKPDPHTGDLSRVGDDRVLEPAFSVVGRDGVAAQLNRLRNFALIGEDQAFAIDDLEDGFVDVHRVSICSGVVDLPDLGRPDRRVLGDSIHPLVRRDIPVSVHGTEQRLDRALDLLLLLAAAFG